VLSWWKVSFGERGEKREGDVLGRRNLGGMLVLCEMRVMGVRRLTFGIYICFFAEEEVY